MSYNEDNVKGKLTSLNESQDSIVTVAQWIMFHRRYAAQTAQLWVATLQESPTANKKLNLLYLANEVVQQSRARGKMDFKIAFEPVIAVRTKPRTRTCKGRYDELWRSGGRETFSTHQFNRALRRSWTKWTRPRVQASWEEVLED